MRVFELHFNPKKKRESVFDSFVYEPEAPQENKIGNLYIAGELAKALPQNGKFLSRLAEIIKNGFYEKADFSEALKTANDFLEKEAKSGNVNWLGNLDFAIVNIGNSVLNFTKTGDIKVLLLRQGEVLDISQNLELQDQEPYPMKVFSNIASGKLLAQDKILILTKEIFGAISQNENILNQLNEASGEKEIKKVFKINKDAISEISGICLFVSETTQLNKGKMPGIGLKIPLIKVPKRIVLIIGFVLILVIAYFIFRDTENDGLVSSVERSLEDARSKIMMAENFVIMKKDEKAQALFQEAWDILEPIRTQEAILLKESIEKRLKK